MRQGRQALRQERQDREEQRQEQRQEFRQQRQERQEQRQERREQRRLGNPRLQRRLAAEALKEVEDASIAKLAAQKKADEDFLGGINYDIVKSTAMLWQVILSALRDKGDEEGDGVMAAQAAEELGRVVLDEEEAAAKRQGKQNKLALKEHKKRGRKRTATATAKRSLGGQTSTVRAQEALLQLQHDDDDASGGGNSGRGNCDIQANGNNNVSRSSPPLPPPHSTHRPPPSRPRALSHVHSNKRVGGMSTGSSSGEGGGSRSRSSSNSSLIRDRASPNQPQSRASPQVKRGATATT